MYKYIDSKMNKYQFPLMYSWLQKGHSRVQDGTYSKMRQTNCEEIVDTNLAVVTIQIDTPVLTTMVKSRKTSFSEQLANLGRAKSNLETCSLHIVLKLF